MYQEAERRKSIRLGEDGNALVRLIVVNAVVFVLLNFIFIVYLLSNLSADAFYSQILQWVRLPGSFDLFLERPWTLLTHFISHFSVWQVLSNMLWLWAFGFILQDLTGNRHIVPLYIYGSLVGGLLFVLSVNLFPVFRSAASAMQYLGGSPGVMAVAVATTLTAPNYRIFPMINGGIPIWVITLIYVLIDFGGMASQSFPFHLAHLGGAIIAPLYVQALRSGRDAGSWMHRFYEWALHLFNPNKPSPHNEQYRRVYYRTEGRAPFHKTPNVTQQRVDEILDKISQKGYHFLTAEEKEILKRASED